MTTFLIALIQSEIFNNCVQGPLHSQKKSVEFGMVLKRITVALKFSGQLCFVRCIHSRRRVNK